MNSGEVSAGQVWGWEHDGSQFVVEQVGSEVPPQALLPERLLPGSVVVYKSLKTGRRYARNLGSFTRTYSFVRASVTVKG